MANALKALEKITGEKFSFSMAIRAFKEPVDLWMTWAIQDQINRAGEKFKIKLVALFMKLPTVKRVGQ